ncbi:MAG: zinc ribbon domain-containing protein [Clostridia bacterium]|nr:zinc ribbon domain-containing protein [Clostridia bacterium]
MALSSYCKKCGRDVPISDRCPHCGARLPANTVRLAWCVDHTPVKDWMCWNSVMRVALPVIGMTLLLTLVLEGVMGGLRGIELLLGGGLIATMLGFFVMLLAVTLLVFILQGDELLDCVVDARGIHVQQYLPNPTPLKLVLRLRSPKLMADLGDEPIVLISQKEILWKDIARVQLWPEKTMILLYAPKWWLRLALPCTPFTWEDALDLIRDKIGKKKNILLPEALTQSAPAKAKTVPKKTHQLSIDDIPYDDPVPETFPEEQEGDFTSLADVLAEIRENEHE